MKRLNTVALGLVLLSQAAMWALRYRDHRTLQVSKRRMHAELDRITGTQ